MPKRKEQAQTQKPKEGVLTAKQAQFVREYLIDLNATQSAIRAGYSANTANEQGCRLLTNVSVAAAVAKATAERAQRNEITADRVLRELAKIAFSDIRKAVTWANDVREAEDDGGAVLESSVLLVPSEHIDDDTAAAISEISNTAQGVKIKFHDKKSALVDLGKHLGMFKEQLDVTHSVRFLIEGLEKP